MRIRNGATAVPVFDTVNSTELDAPVDDTPSDAALGPLTESIGFPINVA